MSAPPPKKLFGITNELAKERNRAAAQRTINAWIGNSLSFIGLGVAVDQIFRSFRQHFPEREILVTATATRVASMAFVGVGLVLLFLALMQHRLEIKTIERDDYVLLSVNALNRVVVVAILLAGFLSFFAILFLL